VLEAVSGEAGRIFAWSAILFSVLLEFLFWSAISCTNAVMKILDPYFAYLA